MGLGDADSTIKWEYPEDENRPLGSIASVSLNLNTSLLSSAVQRVYYTCPVTPETRPGNPSIAKLGTGSKYLGLFFSSVWLSEADFPLHLTKGCVALCQSETHPVKEREASLGRVFTLCSPQEMPCEPAGTGFWHHNSCSALLSTVDAQGTGALGSW